MLRFEVFDRDTGDTSGVVAYKLPARPPPGLRRRRATPGGRARACSGPRAGS